MASHLRRGIEHLRKGEAKKAISALTTVVDDDAFAAAENLTDIRGRATSLLAQALLSDGQFEQAHRRAADALELTHSVDDSSGAAEIVDLLAQISAAEQNRAEERKRARTSLRLAQTDVADLRRLYARDRQSLAEVLLKKANAELEAGRSQVASELAHEVLTQAVLQDWRRQEVLARLSIARVNPIEAETQLNAAWVRAERDSDHTLISTVARAAALAGVALPSLVGPEMPPTKR